MRKSEYIGVWEIHESPKEIKDRVMALVGNLDDDVFPEKILNSINVLRENKSSGYKIFCGQVTRAISLLERGGEANDVIVEEIKSLRDFYTEQIKSRKPGSGFSQKESKTIEVIGFDKTHSGENEEIEFDWMAAFKQLPRPSAYDSVQGLKNFIEDVKVNEPLSVKNKRILRGQLKNKYADASAQQKGIVDSFVATLGLDTCFSNKAIKPFNRPYFSEEEA